VKKQLRTYDLTELYINIQLNVHVAILSYVGDGPNLWMGFGLNDRIY
jgi:hypothetical protein